MVIKSYTYSDRAEGETQYDVAGYSNEKIVPAHYIPALVPMDKGNPFIEALIMVSSCETMIIALYPLRVHRPNNGGYSSQSNHTSVASFCLHMPHGGV